jgi:hypothetical protein
MKTAKTNKLPRVIPLKQTAGQNDEQKKYIDIWEEDNPRCVINMVSDAVKLKVKALPSAWFSYPENTFRRIVDPNEIDDCLREAFWMEYFSACDESRRMRMEAVYGRYMSKVNFFTTIISNEKRLAWMMRPPLEYAYRMKGLLEVGLQQFENILKMEITKADTRLIGEIVKIVALLDNRVRGAVTQRIQVESKSVNVNANYEVPKSYSEISKEIRDVQKEILQLKDPSSPQPDAVLDEALFSSSEDEVESDVREPEVITVKEARTRVTEAPKKRRG